VSNSPIHPNPQAPPRARKRGPPPDHRPDGFQVRGAKPNLGTSLKATRGLVSTNQTMTSHGTWQYGNEGDAPIPQPILLTNLPNLKSIVETSVPIRNKTTNNGSGITRSPESSTNDFLSTSACR
jgi:hypothetical protein